MFSWTDYGIDRLIDKRNLETFKQNLEHLSDILLVDLEWTELGDISLINMPKLKYYNEIIGNCDLLDSENYCKSNNTSDFSTNYSDNDISVNNGYYK